MLEPRIVFEDTHLIVVDKPAGLLSQGEHTGDENLVDWLRLYFGRNYVGLVHRLDRNTSGLMVVAKRTKSAQRLTSALQEGTLQRSYLAWLCGDVREPGHWEHWLLKDEKANTVRAVRAGAPGAKLSSLRYSPIEHRIWREQPLTLTEFELETGRSHQIRIQAAASGFPLLGDRKYLPADALPAAMALHRPALHSHRIRFPHPMSHEVIQFESPLPGDLRLAS